MKNILCGLFVLAACTLKCARCDACLVQDPSGDGFGSSLAWIFPGSDRGGQGLFIFGAPLIGEGAGAVCVYDPAMRKIVRWINPRDGMRLFGEEVVAISDITSDGVQDIVVAWRVAGHPERANLTAYCSVTGAELWNTVAVSPSNSWRLPMSLAFDADGDGLADLAIGLGRSLEPQALEKGVELVSSRTGQAVCVLSAVGAASGGCRVLGGLHTAGETAGLLTVVTDEAGTNSLDVWVTRGDKPAWSTGAIDRNEGSAYRLGRSGVSPGDSGEALIYVGPRRLVDQDFWLFLAISQAPDWSVREMHVACLPNIVRDEVGAIGCVRGSSVDGVGEIVIGLPGVLATGGSVVFVCSETGRHLRSAAPGKPAMCFGQTLLPIGDVNGDNVDDLLVGDVNDQNPGIPGQVFVVCGRDGSVINLVQATL